MKKEVLVLAVVDGKISYQCVGCEAKMRGDAPSGGKKFSITCPKCGKKQAIRVEYRKSKRKKMDRIANIKSNSFKKRIPIIIRDLSIGGIAFDASPDILIGSEAEITFQLDFSKREQGEVTLAIRIVSKKGNRYGSEFLNLPDYSSPKKYIYWWAEFEE